MWYFEIKVREERALCLRKIVSRLCRDATADAFAVWQRKMIEHAARSSFLRKIVSQLLRQQSSMAFARWKREIKLRQAKAASMRKIVARLRRRQTSTAFVSWNRVIKVRAARTLSLRKIGESCDLSSPLVLSSPIVNACLVSCCPVPSCRISPSLSPLLSLLRAQIAHQTVSHLFRQKSMVALRKWSRKVKAQVARSSSLRKIVVRLRHRGSAIAFARWFRLSKLHAARASAMRMIASYRLRASRAQAFSHWNRVIKFEVISKQQEALAKYIFGQKFGEKFSETRNYLAKVMTEWRRASIEQQRDRALLRRLVSRRYSLALGSAFTRWNRTTQLSLRAEQKVWLVDTMCARAKLGRLARSFRTFTKSVFEAKRLRNVQLIALGVRDQRTKRRCVRTLKERAIARQHARLVLSRAGRVLRHGMLRAAVATWYVSLPPLC